MTNQSVVVLGSGAWGTALGMALYRAGCQVSLLSTFPDERNVLKKTRRNTTLAVDLPPELNIGPCLDGVAEGTEAYDELFQVMSCAEAVFWTIPTPYTESTARAIKTLIHSSVPIVICSKGLVWNESAQQGRLISEELQLHFENQLCVLSGPNFAKEVAHGKFAASALSSFDVNIGKEVAALIGSSSFKIYMNRDVVGTQVAGALKNVLAIACGFVSGLDMGQNTRAVIFDQGLSEIITFVQKCGGIATTLLGLSGIADMSMTCFSDESRNTTFGIGVGRGESIDVLSKKIRAEGFSSVKPAYFMARSFGIQTPVIDAIYNVLHCGCSAGPSIRSLLKGAQA
ncbi:MAG: NAD(P)H-dependent glycerol-3-phosphate dehydrogenase [Holosporales bacterium]|jgi:glycerol-3-phosphate dehydrogenase (NAD(P)+)|nr:NAD(P)H-dependent glycerol-3-phosphate dehydrogenase [Holosporales bacterium]